jgi:hypothetical protein
MPVQAARFQNITHHIEGQSTAGYVNVNHITLFNQGNRPALLSFTK